MVLKQKIKVNALSTPLKHFSQNRFKKKARIWQQGSSQQFGLLNQLGSVQRIIFQRDDNKPLAIK